VPLAEEATCRTGTNFLSRLFRGGVVPIRCSAGSDQLSTRSLQIAHNYLVRAIRQAEADDIIGRNVASLVRPPAGRDGRPSKAMSESQARALLDAAATGARRANRGGGAPRPFRLHAYVVLLLTTGMRPEEARALRWDHLDIDAGTMSIWRSDRAGGDTKTSRSRRTLKLPAIAVAALRERSKAQAVEKLKAGGGVGERRTGLHDGAGHQAGPGQHPA
jgi:integrase